MLQQTQVETVLPYFEKWMALYPDLTSLAKADEGSVLKLWEGLGYYSRCRNLLSAARAMVREGFSVPPADALSRYPGIGPYTAGAIASIAYNLPVPAVDGNTERVMARLFDLEETAGSSALKRLAAEKVLRTMPQETPRAFNQALMELGALVCLPPPKNPSCGDCPLAEVCAARMRGVQSLRPLPKPRPLLEKIQAWGVLCFIDGLCLLRRRPSKGLWAGFWEIPWFPRQTENSRADVTAWGKETGFQCLSCREVGTARFSFTNHQVTAWFVTCEATPLPPLTEKIRAGEWGLHSIPTLHSLTLPAPSRKFLKLMTSIE
jgi:A/G-specific adenine glycosylase